jgi:membrane-bound ClpP family serine protease
VGGARTFLLTFRGRNVTGFRFDQSVTGQWMGMGILLTILGIILIVAGVLGVLRGQLLWGIIAIVVGLFVAPGYFYGF